MFARYHFYYEFTFTAKNDNHTNTYSFTGSSDDMLDHFEKVKQLFYDDFGETPTEVHRDSAIRIDITKH